MENGILCNGRIKEENNESISSTNVSPTSSPTPPRTKFPVDNLTAATSSDEGESLSVKSSSSRDPTPNGISTSEANGSTNSDDTVPNSMKSNGKLEFYKEGILCLELSHYDEGSSSKWFKTKGKNETRNFIKITKEVTIPCSTVVPNTVFSSPSSCPNSSKNDHFSDDGSSTLSSSPKPKERIIWKKSHVPQKNTSCSLEFYMKPAKCNLRLEQKNIQKFSRKPYKLILIQPPQLISSSDTCDCGKNLIRLEKNKNQYRKSKIINNRDLEELICKLKEKSKETNLIKKVKETGILKSNGISSPLKSIKKSGVTSPRKRNSKEIDSNEAKKSSCRNIEKSILSIPGANIKKSRESFPKFPVPLPIFYGCDFRESKYQNDNSKIRPQDLGPTCSSSAKNSYSLLKPIPTDAESSSKNLTEPKNLNDEALSAEEQQQIQQHAMSKAISYTINSLLGGGGLNCEKVEKCSPNLMDHNFKGLIHPNFKMHMNSIFGLGSEQDQNSFLRHLLDTSDPIPGTGPTPHSSNSSPSPVDKIQTKGSKAKTKAPVVNKLNIPQSSIQDGELNYSYNKYGTIEENGLHSLVALQYNSRLHPPNYAPPYGVPFSNNLTPPMSSSQSLYEESEAPINLSQKDGAWPTAKNVLPIVDRALQPFNLTTSSPHIPIDEDDSLDPNVPLDLCKKSQKF